MTGLAAQLRAYHGAVDAAQQPLDLAEVAARRAPVRPASAVREPIRRPLLLASSVAVIAAVVSAAVILAVTRPANPTLPGIGDGSSPVATSVAGGTEPIPTGPDAWCWPGTGGEGEDVAIGPDGSVWAVDDPLEPGIRIVRTMPDGPTRAYPMVPGASDMGGGGVDWPPGGRLPDPTINGPWDLEVAADGTLYLSGGLGWSVPGPGVFRLDQDAGTWELVPLAGGEPAPAVAIEATCDGGLWVLTVDHHMADESGLTWELGDPAPEGTVGLWHPEAEGYRLLQLTDDQVELVAGPPENAASPNERLPVPFGMVADDRAVWLFNGIGWSEQGLEPFGGVARFADGAWTTYLDADDWVWKVVLGEDGTAIVDVGSFSEDTPPVTVTLDQRAEGVGE